MNVRGRVVAITGAGSGIGSAMAHEAAVRGAAAVAVIDIDEKAAHAVAERLVAGGTAARAYRLDVCDADATGRVVAEVRSDLGIPGLVCANAGVSPAGAPLLEADVRDISWALDVNVVGTWATLQAFGSIMAAGTDPGWLLVTASEHAVGVPFPGTGAYTVSKHAVLGLADVLRREVPDHLGVSVLLPGLVDTDIWKSGRLRPETKGGPSEDNEMARMLLSHGMAADVVASRAFDGVERETFLIASHAHVRRYADARAVDIAEAFDSLEGTGVQAESESYDVMEVVAAMTAAHDE